MLQGLTQKQNDYCAACKTYISQQIFQEKLIIVVIQSINPCQAVLSLPKTDSNNLHDGQRNAKFRGNNSGNCYKKTFISMSL